MLLRYLPFGGLFPLQAEGGSLLGDLFSGSSGDEQTLLLVATGLVVLLIVLALVLMAQVIAVNQIILKKLKKESAKTEAAGLQPAESSSFWAWFWDKFNRAASGEKEKKILLDHNYDGIHELDNDLPPWWKYGFYFTILFAVVYFFRFHISWGGDDVVSIQEYKESVALAEARKAEALTESAESGSAIDETNVELLADEGSLATGKKIYDLNCKVCHGGAGEGLVGPNLTDKYWIHGGSIQDVFKVIKYGVPDKGMLPWKDNLRPKQIQEVASFIMTLQGTNPPNGKAPQGEEYIPAEK